MDAVDLGRERGGTVTFPIPLATPDAGRIGATSPARAEEEATLRSFGLPAEPPAVASRLALVKLGLRTGCVGFAGLPSRETRGTFGDSTPIIGLNFASFTDIFEEVGDW